MEEKKRKIEIGAPPSFVDNDSKLAQIVIQDIFRLFSSCGLLMLGAKRRRKKVESSVASPETDRKGKCWKLQDLSAMARLK